MDRSAGNASTSVAPRCEACHDVIGVYEPLIHVYDGTVRRTSRAAEPSIDCLSERCYHLGCYESLASSR